MNFPLSLKSWSNLANTNGTQWNVRLCSSTQLSRCQLAQQRRAKTDRNYSYTKHKTRHDRCYYAISCHSMRPRPSDNSVNASACFGAHRRSTSWITNNLNQAGHSFNDVCLIPIELIRSKRDSVRKAREAHLINKAKTLHQKRWGTPVHKKKWSLGTETGS